MYCNQCGAKIPDGNRFCENCGAPVQDRREHAGDRAAGRTGAPGAGQTGASETGQSGVPGHGPADAPQTGQAPAGTVSGRQKLSRRTVILIAVICALVIGGIAGGIVAAVSSHNSTGKYQDKIDEGNQYLDSEQYDDALTAFDDAIAIEPKKPDGYLGKATVQSRQGKHKEALATLDQAKQNVVDDAGIKKIDEMIRVETGKYEGEWKTAYRKVLQDHEAGIRAYEDMEYGSGVDDTTALCDLDEDGTDELLFFEEETENAQYRLRIYTYTDGAAVEVPYTWTPSEPNMGEATEGYRDIWAAGGTKYIVYKEKGTKGVTIYSTIMDEFIGVDIVRYEMSGQTMESLDAFGYNFDFVREDTYVDHVDPDLAEYYRNAAATSREDYDKSYNASKAAMEQAIFCSADGSRGDDPEIWQQAEDKGVLAMPLDEMLEELTVPAEEAETDGDGSAASAEDVRYGETMEKLLQAYKAGDRATVEEANAQLPERYPQMEISDAEWEAFSAAYDDLDSRGLLSEDFGGVMGYADVDNDGGAECLIDSGKSEAERMLYVYKYQDGQAILLGSTWSGHSTFCQYPNHNGIVRYCGHMDHEQLDLMTFENGEAKETPYGSNDYTLEQINNGEYYISLGCRIWLE